MHQAKRRTVIHPGNKGAGGGFDRSLIYRPAIIGRQPNSAVSALNTVTPELLAGRFPKPIAGIRKGRSSASASANRLPSNNTVSVLLLKLHERDSSCKARSIYHATDTETVAKTTQARQSKYLRGYSGRGELAGTKLGATRTRASPGSCPRG